MFWPEGPGPNDAGLSRKHVIASLKGSLRRLRTDYINVYQLLRFDYKTPVPGPVGPRAARQEAQVISVSDRLGIGQFAAVPLAQGVLTGEYGNGAVPPGSRSPGPCSTKPSPPRWWERARRNR
ncbi:aldo/keto reductase [Amycolatopsis sp. FU40]|uniref:aldo/keto reductase n=1 Tax=Amycolatopsis TaxID=1813 RepID=UPI00351D4AE2